MQHIQHVMQYSTSLAKGYVTNLIIEKGRNLNKLIDAKLYKQ